MTVRTKRRKSNVVFFLRSPSMLSSLASSQKFEPLSLRQINKGVEMNPVIPGFRLALTCVCKHVSRLVWFELNT